MDSQGDKLNLEDLRWAEMVHKAVSGLESLAEMQCEGCDTSWLAMFYSLQSIRETMDAIVDDFKDRLNCKKED